MNNSFLYGDLVYPFVGNKFIGSTADQIKMHKYLKDPQIEV